MRMFRVHRTLEEPEVGSLHVCANRFTRKVVEARFIPAGSDKVYFVAPPSVAMEIIQAKNQDEALATLRYWAQGLP